MEFDLFAAIKDEIEPLLSFKLGDLKLDIHQPKNLSAKESLDYVNCQIYSAAIASEYQKISDQMNELVRAGENISREIAEKYFDLSEQLKEKNQELNEWTAKYIECLARIKPNSLVASLQEAIAKEAIAVEAEQILTKLFRKINEELATITQKSDEPKYATPTEEVGKPPESDSPPIANDSASSLPSSALLTDYQG